MNWRGRHRVDISGRHSVFWGIYIPQKQSSICGRQVDYFLSKLLGYIYIIDNKGKVDMNSKGGSLKYLFSLPGQVVWGLCLPVYPLCKMEGLV
jgi:hypothetical protein